MHNENLSPEEVAQETLRLTKENNHMLKAMRRDAMVGGLVRIVLWLVVLGGSYYLTMVYLEPLLNMFTGAAEMRPEDFQRLFEEYHSQFSE